MRAIQLDVQSSKQSAEIFKEVTDGQIVMTNGWGQSILARLQWRCERLIVIKSDPAIQPNDLNVGEMLKTITIEQGFQIAKELQQVDENLIVMCCHGTLFGYQVFGTTQPRNWLDRNRAREISAFFYRRKLDTGVLYKEAAKVMGITDSRISLICSGKQFPSRLIREKLAEAYGCSADVVHALFENALPFKEIP